MLLYRLPEKLYICSYDSGQVAQGEHREGVAGQGGVDSGQRDGVPPIPMPVAIPGQGPADLEPLIK